MVKPAAATAIVDCVRTEKWTDEPVDVFWDWVESIGSVRSGGGNATSGSGLASASISVFQGFVKGLARKPTLNTTV